MTTWRRSLDDALERTGDSLIATTMTDEQLDTKFSDGYGWSDISGCPFTAWGEKYVYFPVTYDGSKLVGYVRRDPCNEASEHWGG